VVWKQHADELARNVARSAALALVDELDLDSYYPFHATRADLLRRVQQLKAGDPQIGWCQEWAPCSRSQLISASR
jgi:predicted RNA polymerase sigma factor